MEELRYNFTASVFLYHMLKQYSKDRMERGSLEKHRIGWVVPLA